MKPAGRSRIGSAHKTVDRAGWINKMIIRSTSLLKLMLYTMGATKAIEHLAFHIKLKYFVQCPPHLNYKRYIPLNYDSNTLSLAAE